MLDDPIDQEILLVEEAMNHSDAIIDIIMSAARVGRTREWYLENWRTVVTSNTDAVLEDLESLAPWVETWIDEAYSRVEKETNS